MQNEGLTEEELKVALLNVQIAEAKAKTVEAEISAAQAADVLALVKENKQLALTRKWETYLRMFLALCASVYAVAYTVYGSDLVIKIKEVLS